MNYKITNGAIELDGETILQEINIHIKDREKVAIIGRNGAGKSTLLKAIVDNSLLTEGTGNEKFNVYKEGTPVIGYLKQMELEDENCTMLDEILKVYKPIIDLEQKIANLLEKMQNDKSEELASEYSKAMDRFEFLDGYTYKKEYETAISKFGFSKEDRQKKITEFSGGQRAKISFIKLLLSKPDILLLDEPTNHLDITAIEWLEQYLKNYPKAVVIVSHDRMFINKIVNKIYEIEYGETTEYSGDYNFFEAQKKINYERQLKDYEFQQKEIKRLNDIVTRFKYKPSKASMAMSKLKQIERMVKIESPNRYDLTTFKTNFEIDKPSGKEVLFVKDLEIGYKDPIQKLSFNVYRGQKIGIIGENGIGKSTLLKTLTDEIPKLGGEYEFGHNVTVGYFDQQIALSDSDKTVMEDFQEAFPKLTTTETRNSLAAFMFFGEDVFKKISMLSGGEKVRLALCKILKRKPNLLILDEPTNHMDIIGKESLESMLKAYTGTILVVSHDRFFVNKIADALLVFKRSGVKYYECTYEEYERNYLEEEVEEIPKEQKEKKVNNLYVMQKEKNKMATRIKKIERDIDEYENTINKLNEELSNPANYSDYEKLNDLQNQIAQYNEKVELCMAEWEELSEKIDE